MRFPTKFVGVFICRSIHMWVERVYGKENLYVLPARYVRGKSCCSQTPFIPQCVASHHILKYPLVFVLMWIWKFHIIYVSSGHLHFVAKLQNDLEMKLVHTPKPQILLVSTLRLLFFGLIRCTHCSTLNCTYIPSIKQSNAYRKKCGDHYNNVSAWVLCG